MIHPEIYNNIQNLIFNEFSLFIREHKILKYKNLKNILNQFRLCQLIIIVINNLYIRNSVVYNIFE